MVCFFGFGRDNEVIEGQRKTRLVQGGLSGFLILAFKVSSFYVGGFGGMKTCEKPSSLFFRRFCV
jgi:hypothetical protein